ncbi:unnamed protein product, partial [Arabidopsis halleri]
VGLRQLPLVSSTKKKKLPLVSSSTSLFSSSTSLFQLFIFEAQKHSPPFLSPPSLSPPTLCVITGVPAKYIVFHRCCFIPLSSESAEHAGPWSNLIYLLDYLRIDKNLLEIE